MKKITTMVTTFLVAAMSLGNVTTYAAETTEAPCKFERPAVAENFKNFKAGKFSFEGKEFQDRETVPMCWQFWHAYRIEDLVSNILMANQEQIFNEEWQRKIGASITDTGNALELDEAIAFGKGIKVDALLEYMITTLQLLKIIPLSLNQLFKGFHYPV